MGSPPHGRGKARCGSVYPWQLRITPAWAGKSRTIPRRRSAAPDHPRMGGEKFINIGKKSGVKGSPPHGRGKAEQLFDVGDALGITPAWAGKSWKRQGRTSTRRDHPRMGGEKLEKTRPDIYPEGSPPHGRGKVHPLCSLGGFLRITPAWAGKRLRCCICCRISADHPRMGGEKRGTSAMAANAWGSPPHGRGKACAVGRTDGWLRITPAWAGKRLLQTRGRDSGWDHPRMGGEKYEGYYNFEKSEGSPPHGRGKGDEEDKKVIGMRITPAWAGKSSIATRKTQSTGDHPRMGGEKYYTTLGCERQ